MIPALAIVLLGTYLFASWNFSIALSRVAGFPDPRTQKSGNPGASNVARVAGRFWAAVVLSLDLVRAVVIWFVASSTLPGHLVSLAGLALILGNRFPLFHRFKGGKGVAAYLGFVAAALPWVAGVACAAWLVVYLLARVPALASMAMLLVLFLATLLTTPVSLISVMATLLSVVLVVIGHRGNLQAWRNHRSLKSDIPQ
jgi:glycerol-3-phosphate acyltransferase PlsY